MGLHRWFLRRSVARHPVAAFDAAATRLGVEGVAVRVPPSSALFRAGDGEVVELPYDRSIATTVMARGTWQPEAVEFLASHAPAAPTVLVDVGAHVGLVARALVHRVPSVAWTVCVEPHPVHVAYLRRNLAHLRDWHVLDAALDAAGAPRALLEDRDNGGNCSLHPAAMHGRPHGTRTVRCVAPTAATLLASVPPALASAPILWKSDTQGSDEAIVTALPDAFWSRVVAGTMELWRMERAPFHRDRLRAVLAGFPVLELSDAPGRRASLDDVLAYVAGRDDRQCDLHFARVRSQARGAPVR